MIVTKKEPFTNEEIEWLAEELETYIKTVIDIEKNVCSAGASLHADNEQILLELGSHQDSLWGGGIDLKTLTVGFNAMINLRPKDNNTSNEILDPAKRQRFEYLMKDFFKVLYQQVASE